MQEQELTFAWLPIEQVEQDSSQPRKNIPTEESEQSLKRLQDSIEKHGMRDPIKVVRIDDKRYKLIDGHRRHTCAGRAKWTKVPCVIYPKMSSGELSILRYQLQNNRRNWKPAEKSNALYSIKTENGIKTNKELAQRVILSVTAVSNSLLIRDQKVEYLELMEKFQLPESYRIEFVRLKSKLRKIKNLEIDTIIIKIFEKVKNNVIRSAKEFRKIAKIFSRATANEEELYNFLTDPDATVTDLDMKTVQSGFSLLLEQILQALLSRKKNAVPYSSKDQVIIDHIKKVI